MKRLFLILILAAAAVAVAAGLSSCGNTKKSLADYKGADGRIEVEFWHAMAGGQARVLNKIIDDYNNSQEKYRVKGIYQGAYNSLSQKLIASLYAGRQPVVAQMYESWVTRFLRYHCLQPVQHFIADDPEFTDADVADLYEGFRRNNTYNAVFDEKIGGYRLAHAGEKASPILATLPFNKSVYVLYVNDSAMREAGHETPPRTWSELMQYAKDLTLKSPDGKIERYGYAARPMIESFTVWLMSADGNYMDAADTEFTFDGPEGMAAMEFTRELVLGKDSVGYVESDYLSNVFGAGKIAMYLGSTASFPYNDSSVGNKFIWRAYPIPMKDGAKVGGVLSQGTNVGLFRRGFPNGTEIPEEVQRGGWEFLKYLSSKEATAEWAIGTGYMPVRKSALETPLMKAHMDGNVNFANALGQLDRATYEAKPIWWDTFRNDVMSPEVDAVMFGRRGVDAAMAAAKEKALRVRKTAGS